MQIRQCPRCNSERPATEFLCQGNLGGTLCNWDMTNVPLSSPGHIAVAETAPIIPAQDKVCINGHPYDDGDIICLECGANLGGNGSEIDRSEGQLPDGWQLDGDLKQTGEVRERFLVTNNIKQGVLTFYREGSEPDQDVQNVLRNMDVDHIPKLLEAGRFRGRSYEVFEYITGGCLNDITFNDGDREIINRVVDEIGRALDDFAQVGLRHRDLRPDNILIRSHDSFDLVIDGFGSARLSDFDLDVESPLEITKYMAPEAIAGGVAAASDWWSLGMILLEKLTHGACFSEIHEQAFLINILANGVPLPDNLDSDVSLLLRGLLARDREDRWQWEQVKAWLDGDPVEAPYTRWEDELDSGPPIDLGGITYRSIGRYSLASSEQGNWDEACRQFSDGTLLNWLGELQFHKSSLSTLRSIRNSNLESDDQFSIVLKVLNPDMPLIRHGEIISPAWLIANPINGYRLISGDAPILLDDLKTEPWVGKLKRREERVREVAKYHEVKLNEEQFQILLVATSVAQFKAQWEGKRKLFPDTDHHGLATLMERRQVAEEDLIILCAAEIGQFRTVQEIVDESAKLAKRSGEDEFDIDKAKKLLNSSTKGKILKDVEERIRNFAACSIDELDKWADQFRIENRISLSKALVLHGVSQYLWKVPPRHAYVKQLISYFEQKLSLSIRQGPLSRMTIAKTSAKIDLTEIESTGQSAEALLNSILKRTEYQTTLDPEPFIQDQILERRLRNLERHATLYKRDTGIDGLYLGFPFLLLQLPNRNSKPRIAPVLLWPVKLTAEVGQQGQIRLAFDNDREEVRFNPAIENYVGTEAFKRWGSIAKELLGRSISAKDVIDEFGRLVTPRGRDLVKLPGINTKVPAGPGELASSAVLFHVKFMGQAIVEDLRNLADQRIEGSALEPILRLSDVEPIPIDKDKIPENEKFLVVDSDPSQEKAVFDARGKPGLVISGPPGTGKSQTIVNIVADAIGRENSLLVVCQKQAALEVVKKRLEADGLGDRIVLVTDENRDRKQVVKLIREQVEGLLRDGLNTTLTNKKRSEVAAQLENIEYELDSQHCAIHEIDDISGLSYRDLIAELVALEEADRQIIDCLDLRSVIASLEREVVNRARERCSSLSKVWIKAKFEGSALAVLEEFDWDPATIKAFSSYFLRYFEAESVRQDNLANRITPVRLEESKSSRKWLNQYRKIIENTSESTLVNLGKCIDLFKGSSFKQTRAGWCANELKTIKRHLSNLDHTACDLDMHSVTVLLNDHEFMKIHRKCLKVTSPVGMFGSVNPIRKFRRWSLVRWLNTNGLKSDNNGLHIYTLFVILESKLRPLRKQYQEVQRTLSIDLSDAQTQTHSELLISVSDSMLAIKDIMPLAAALLICPLRDKAIQAAKSSSPNSIRSFIRDVEYGCDQADARANSLSALSTLVKWVYPEWLARQNSNIRTDSEEFTEIVDMNAAIPTVADFQKYRVRSRSLKTEERAIFNALRSVESELEKIPEEDLGSEIQRIIDREQRLYWKTEAERRTPAILADRSEIESKIRTLEDADHDMRDLNQNILSKGLNITRLANRSRWEDITRLSGVRMKRLREFVRYGVDLGLTSVRPVWLMNPEVVSRVLPLARGLFDVVVFDEASQMPVEQAIPALYRGSVAIVSGDEKQLPPTAFFSSKIESDEAEFSEGDVPEEDATDEELEALEEIWDRREIKNCPNLLALANTSLPSTLLEIHYRSQYRELISFSNHSFYAGRLHVPARHPKEKILYEKPIEVLRVNGLYEHQLNIEEAKRVVKETEKLWLKPRNLRPTIGVVTFNRKQADLILEHMETYAEKNAEFRKAYTEENERIIDGEDMQFFVKNVENVQGDERDVMIFSTTFGRNPQGTFRRTFGVLGQKGGERRLNVAVTRAKRKIVLVTSMPVQEISDFLASRRKASSPRDYLQAYLYYAEHMSSGQLDVANSLLSRLNSSYHNDQEQFVEVEDGFSKTVAEFIETQLCLKPVPANDGTVFGIDYAIEDPNTGLFGIGIECDAPNHSLLRKARSREIWRRKVLGQSIRKIHRVSSYGWYHNRNEEQIMLKQAINDALS